MKSARMTWGKALRLACAIALICLGFAHRPPVLVNDLIPLAELSNYVLPDGSLAELCVPGSESDGKAPHSGMGSGCEACRLSAATILPSPPASAGEPMARVLAVLAPPRGENVTFVHFRPGHAPRAPPIASSLT